MSNPISDLLNASMDKLRTMVDANTVMGNPITTADGATVIPISKIKLGYAGGGSEFNAKSPQAEKPYGGGSGAGVQIIPVAFLILRENSSRVLPIPEPAGSTADRLVEQLPDLADKIWTFIQQKKAESALHSDPEK